MANERVDVGINQHNSAASARRHIGRVFLTQVGNSICSPLGINEKGHSEAALGLKLCEQIL